MQAANNPTLFHQYYFSIDMSKQTNLATQCAHMLAFFQGKYNKLSAG